MSKINFSRYFTVKSQKANLRFKLLNILGLTFGLTSGIILFLIVRYEKSFDTYHEKYDQIYRIVQSGEVEGQAIHQVGLPKPMPYEFRDKISGIETITHFYHSRYGEVELIREDGSIDSFFENPGVVYAEPELFQVFDWEWISGDEEKALTEPNSVVLDDVLATKYFGDQNALGKTIKVKNVGDLMVTGIVKRRPNNSDYPFEFFISMKTISGGEEFNNWYSTYSDDRAYVVIHSKNQVAEVERQMNEVALARYNGERRLEIQLQPLHEIHFDEQYGNLNYRVASGTYITTLSIVSVFIVLIACFNFINMSTAVAFQRARDVGVRKILGSTSARLIKKQMVSTFYVVLVSMLISLGLVELLMPTVVQDFAGTVIDYHLLADVEIPLFLTGLLFLVTLIAGYYPAYVISRFKPTDALKNNYATGKKGMLLRRILVVMQFAFAIIFLFGTSVVFQQSRYARSITLGEMKDWVVFLDLPSGEAGNQQVWEGELDKVSGVNKYAFSTHTPFSGSMSSTTATFGKDEDRIQFSALKKTADTEFFGTYGLELVAGEYYQDLQTVEGFVVNEAFVKKLNLESNEEAIGALINYDGHTAAIKGVVKNFLVTTAKREMRPVIMYNDQRNFSTLGIKLNPSNADQVLSSLESIWQSVYSGQEFSYQFYDDYVGMYYENEKKATQMLLLFAGIAVGITCLGLYGIVSYMAATRRKEIGVRRVLGASIFYLVRLFSSEFVRLVIIAFMIASPVAYWLMNQWLEGYAFRMQIGPAIFTFCLLATLMIALLTTSYRSFRAASANPINSLREE
ncbi:ABC transporter permease [Roseivirga sp.]|uniref:ABC transporter permease n=1 Tax=Roseivirga sp. TaxID=1964215 RepID=UPI003B52D746